MMKREFTGKFRILFFCISLFLFGFACYLFLAESPIHSTRRRGLNFYSLTFQRIFSVGTALLATNLLLLATIAPFPYSEKNKGMLEKVRDFIGMLGAFLSAGVLIFNGIVSLIYLIGK